MAPPQEKQGECMQQMEQNVCMDSAGWRRRFYSLPGVWVDQFSAMYVLTQSADDGMDVQTQRANKKPRTTPSLIRSEHFDDLCRIVWGRAGKPPTYIVTEFSDNHVTWSKPGSPKEFFSWARHISPASDKKDEVVTPTLPVASCSLSCVDEGDARSEVESDYGLSSRQLNAVAMKPQRHWDWPQSRSESVARLQYVNMQELVAQHQESIWEIEALKHIIRVQAEELEVLRWQVANGCSQWNGTVTTLDKEGANVACIHCAGQARQHEEHSGASPDAQAEEPVKCDKRTEAIKVRRRRKKQAKQVRAQLQSASPDELSDPAAPSRKGSGHLPSANSQELVEISNVRRAWPSPDSLSTNGGDDPRCEKVDASIDILFLAQARSSVPRPTLCSAADPV